MVRLFLLPLQLSFPGMGLGPSGSIIFVGADLDSDGNAERDQRTSAEWHNAVVSYLKYRAGTGWRLGRFRYRTSHLEYLEAIRLLESIRYSPKLQPEPVLDPLPYEQQPLKLSWWRRPWDHFRRCRCQVCNSLRMRGIDPQSTSSQPQEQLGHKQPGRAVDALRCGVRA